VTTDLVQDTARTPLASLLRRIRQARDLTQEELAEAAGLSARLISDLERGIIQRPRRDTIQMLADGLDLRGAEREQFTLNARSRHWPHPDGDRPAEVPEHQLIGREREIASATALLIGERARLLTLTGPGGVGKTSLAIVIAHAAGAALDVRPVLVDLAPVLTTEGIWAAIAQRLAAAGDSAEQPRERVLAALGDAPHLIILDNLEQIAGAGSVVADLIEHCPGLRVIATSRVRLHLSTEQELPVAPLPLPATNDLVDIDRFQRVPAVALFVRRAREARPSFSVTGNSAREVAEIVTRLDGLPLAIELAAARIRLLSPADLLQRMDPALPVLAGGAVDLPERLRTMRAAIAWSYTLLDGQEQALLRTLSVFSGGFAIEAAEAVTTARDRVNVLDRLEALVDQNLVQVIDAGAGESVRYRLLETIREYAAQQLIAAGEAAAVRDAHAGWCADLAERAEPELVGPDQGAWFDRLELEHDNLRAALAWCISKGRTEPALRAAGSLYRFWAVRGHVTEAQEWLRQVIALPGCDPSRTRGNALLGAGVMAYFRGDLEAAQAHTQDAQDQYRLVDHRPGVGYAYGNLGMIADAAGDDDAAAGLYEHALATFQSLGERTSAGYMLGNLGLVALDRGDLDQAQSRFEEALALFRDLGDADSLGYTICNLGSVAQARGDWREAARLHADALRIRRDLRNMTGIIKELNSFGQICAATGDQERAATLFGAAARLQIDLGVTDSPDSRWPIESSIADVRTALGEREFAVAWERGADLSIEQAIDLALSLVLETPSQP
jgi:predicted ATPase/DNA-binding XRE family transcriptional regulator